MEIKKSIKKIASDEYKTDMLKSGINLDLDISPKPIRMSSTITEFISYFFEPASIREGYVVNENQYLVPVFITKIDGDSSELLSIIRDKHTNNKDVIDIITGYHFLKRPVFCSDNFDDDKIFDNKKLNRSYISNIDFISSLCKAKRNLLFNAIETIIEYKKDIEILSNIDNKDIVKASIFQNDRLFKMYCKSDLELTPSKLVILDTDRTDLNWQAIVRFMLYHYLCFDILVLSKHSYSCIENYLPKFYYDLHKLDVKKESLKSKKSFNKTKIAIGIGSVVSLVTIFLL